MVLEDAILKGEMTHVVVRLFSDGTGRMCVTAPGGEKTLAVARGAHKNVVRRAREYGIAYLVARETRDAFIKHEFYGSRALVQEHRDQLMQQYPPAGYGTKVASCRELENGNGLLMVVTRSQSCD